MSPLFVGLSSMTEYNVALRSSYSATRPSVRASDGNEAIGNRPVKRERGTSNKDSRGCWWRRDQQFPRSNIQSFAPRSTWTPALDRSLPRASSSLIISSLVHSSLLLSSLGDVVVVDPPGPPFDRHQATGPIVLYSLSGRPIVVAQNQILSNHCDWNYN